MTVSAYVISIHAPREGSDGHSPQIHPKTKQISIHAPREGSDPGTPTMTLYPMRFLSTLPARGATDQRAAKLLRWRISIHAPREGSDRSGGTEPDGFQKISIHAPREGSDR